MTEHQKRLAIIFVTVVIGILLLLHSKRGSAGAAVGSDYTLPTVSGPSLGPMYSGGGQGAVYVIPGLNLQGPNLNMIGACCSDCMQSDPYATPTYAGPSYTFNQGNAGASIYNYSALYQNQGAVMYGGPA